MQLFIPLPLPRLHRALSTKAPYSVVGGELRGYEKGGARAKGRCYTDPPANKGLCKGLL